VEVLRAYSNNYALTQRIRRLTRHLATRRDGSPPPARAPYRPHKLSQRLDAATVAAIIAAYEGGTTARELAARHGVARSAITRLLHRHGSPSGGRVPPRRTGSRCWSYVTSVCP
jgi:hypothetical protein